MTDAFEAFQKCVDADMYSWVALSNHDMPLPTPHFIRPASNKKLSFGFSIEGEGEDKDEKGRS